MEWDLGLAGVGVLLALSVGFGLVAEVIGWRESRWIGLIGAAVFFVCGLLISEAWFGWATEEDLQPNYDGLSFDETLLALFPSLAAVLLIRRALRHRERGRAPAARATPPSPGPA